MDKRLESTIDENLRDVPSDPDGMRQYIDELKERLSTTEDFNKRVSLLGEIGVHLRSLRDLKSAEDYLLKALKLVQEHSLGIQRQIQQQLRLAHVWQWMGKYDQSNALFEEALTTCRTDTNVSAYLHFAFQHAGKNLFEQKRFSEALRYFEEAMALRIRDKASTELIESTAIAIAQKKCCRKLGYKLIIIYSLNIKKPRIISVIFSKPL